MLDSAVLMFVFTFPGNGFMSPAVDIAQWLSLSLWDVLLAAARGPWRLGV